MTNTAALSLFASDHPITSVTVFKSSKAEVVRTFELELKKGQNKIEIKGLPSSIDTHSVRVSGLGDARLFDVVCAVKPDKTQAYAPQSTDEVIRKLRTKRQALEAERALKDQQSQLLLKYAQTLTGEHVNPTDMGQFLEIFMTKEQKKIDAIAELQEKIIQLDRQIAAETDKVASKRGTATAFVEIVLVADEGSTVELKLTYIVSNAKWTPTYELHATTENGKPSSSVVFHYRARVTQSTGEDWNNTRLNLSTITSDTFIRHIPKLRTIQLRQGLTFQTQKGGFSLFPNNTDNNQAAKGFNANTNATLRPSVIGPPGFLPTERVLPFVPAPNVQHGPFTQSVFGGQSSFGGGPTIGGLFGAPQSQQQQAQSAFSASTSFGTTSGGNLFGGPAPASTTSTFGFGSAPAPAPPQAPVVPLADEDESEYEEITGPSEGSIVEPSTIVSETPMAVSFSVHGDSTIPSDGIEHQVSVAVLEFTSKISYIVVPRVDPRAFLQCEVKNTSEYRLLPGPVTVIFDDSYVSKTAIYDVNTGENFQCTLGDDPSTKVKYSRTYKTAKSSGGTFSEITNTTTYTTKISIHNQHQFAIEDLVVKDVIPTCDDKDKRAKIVLRQPAGLADAKDGEMVDVGEEKGLKVGWEALVDGKGGEKEGKYEWKWTVGGGEKAHLETEWEIKVPGEAAWVEVLGPVTA